MLHFTACHKTSSTDEEFYQVGTICRRRAGLPPAAPEAPTLTPVPEVPPANPTSGMAVPPGARVIRIPAPAPAQ